MNSPLASSFKGSRFLISKTVTANYTFDDQIEAVNVDTTSGDITITLPLISQNAGRLVTVRKVDSSINTVIIETAGSDLYQDGSGSTLTNQWDVLSIDNDGNQWHTSSGGSSGGGGSGVTTVGTFGSSPNNGGASISSVTITLEPADATHPGGVSIGTQTFAGNKTFLNSISASNLSGSNTGDQTITLTGDVTGTGMGSFAATIAANAVTLAKMAQIATGTLLGRSTASTGNVEVITVGSGLTLSGGTLTAASGGTVTTVSVTTANGVSGSVANPTTTPAISLTLGAITPSSVAATGTVTGSNLSNTNSGDISIGTFGVAPNANGLSVSSQVLTLQPADATHPGSVSTTTQSIPGIKTFTATNLNLTNNNNGDTGFTITNTDSGSSARRYISIVGTGSRFAAWINYPLNWSAFPAVADSCVYTTNHSGGWVWDTDPPVSGTQQGFRWIKDSTTTMMTLSYTTGTLTNVGSIVASNLSGTNTGDDSLAAIGSSPNANGATLTSHVLTLQPASASFGGVVTTGTQSFAGAKTFTGAISASNLSGSNTGDQTITLTGDVTGSGTGSFAATIAANAVTLAKMAQIVTGTLLGRSTASTGNVEVITVGSGLTISGGTLSASGSGTVTTVSITTANGVSGSVANPTTTPAITLTLGAITPSSIAAVGTVTGSNLSNTNTGDVTIGTFGSTPTANGISLSSQVITLQPADATHPGALSTGTQTIAGAKTFNNSLSFAVTSGNNAINFLDGVQLNFSTGDTNAYLYRSTTDTIRTPGSLIIDGTIGASNLSGTNTGDITLDAVNSAGSPNANGATLTGTVLNFNVASEVYPGMMSEFDKVNLDQLSAFYDSYLAQQSVGTTDATPTSTTSLMTMSLTNEVWVVQVEIAARSNDGPVVAGYGIVGTFFNIAGVATQVGTTQVLWAQENDPTWDVDFFLDGSNDINVIVTGAAATNISWIINARQVQRQG